MRGLGALLGSSPNQGPARDSKDVALLTSVRTPSASAHPFPKQTGQDGCTTGSICPFVVPISVDRVHRYNLGHCRPYSQENKSYGLL